MDVVFDLTPDQFLTAKFSNLYTMGLILMTVLLLLGISGIKADEGDTITTTPLLAAEEFTEDSGKSAQITEVGDRLEKRLKSRSITVTSALSTIGNDLKDTADFETFTYSTDVEDRPKKRLRSRYRHRTTTTTTTTPTPPRVNGDEEDKDDLHHKPDKNVLYHWPDEDDDILANIPDNNALYHLPDLTYNPDLTSGTDNEHVSSEEPLENERKYNDLRSSLKHNQSIIKFFAGGFSLFIIGGITACYRLLCKEKPSSTDVPFEILPDLSSAQQTGQTDLLSPSTSQYRSHQSLMSSQQTLAASQQMPQKKPYPTQAFVYPQGKTTYPPPENLN